MTSEEAVCPSPKVLRVSPILHRPHTGDKNDCGTERTSSDAAPVEVTTTTTNSGDREKDTTCAAAVMGSGSVAEDEDEDEAKCAKTQQTKKKKKKKKRACGSTLSLMRRKNFNRHFDCASLGLMGAQLALWNENPHIRQVWVNHSQLCTRQEPLCHSDRVLCVHRFPHSALPAYKRRTGEAKTVEHWGQRKLAVAEIEFLSWYSSPGDTVLYAGAAPGGHINYLATLFPHLRFVLYDPSKFEAVATPQIELHQVPFDNEEASHFCGVSDTTLFISDVRGRGKKTNLEAQVQQDMANQMEWVNIMRPKVSLLKFRLPYTPGTSTYLCGTLYFPVWGGCTTSECRLVVFSCGQFAETCCADAAASASLTSVPDTHVIQQTERSQVEGETTTTASNDAQHQTTPTSQQSLHCLPMCSYDNMWYSDVMYHFNTTLRTSHFPHNVNSAGIDHCYDCASEIHILAVYLNCVLGVTDPDQVTAQVKAMCNELSRAISNTGRTLLSFTEG